MKKIGYVIAVLLEIALYAGAYVFNYFTRRKLGMSRYVGFLNRQIEEAVPIQGILYVGLAAEAALLAAVIVVYYKKRTELKKLPAIMLGVSAVTTAFSAYYVLANNIQTERGYYVLGALFAAAGIVQVLKTLSGCLVCKKG